MAKDKDTTSTTAQEQEQETVDRYSTMGLADLQAEVDNADGPVSDDPAELQRWLRDRDRQQAQQNQQNQ